MIKDFTNIILANYDITISDINNRGKKTNTFTSSDHKQYFFKRTDVEMINKYQFLETQGINNIIYPLLNKEQSYITNKDTSPFYISKYYQQNQTMEDMQAIELYRQLQILHGETTLKRQLSPSFSRPKFEEITNQLDYKFKILEQFVQSVESRELGFFSMPILTNYHLILDGKKELVRLQKRIIQSIKDHERVNYAFIHNNPKNSHIISQKGRHLLTSLEHSKIGIDSLDMAKFYLENGHLNIDIDGILVDYYYSQTSDFYYDYFRFLVLYLICKRITINELDHISTSSFEDNSKAIVKYFNDFKDLNKKDQITKTNDTNNE